MINRECILRFENAGVTYRSLLDFGGKESVSALKNINFELYRGETLGIIGKNAAGKSTLMKLIADIIAPDNGRVYRKVSKIQLLSLQAGFLSHLTGRENAILSGMLLGMRKKQVVSMLPEIEAFADIGVFFERPIRIYSTGMRARLGFAVAVMANPDVLLLDEVLGVGDSQFRIKSKQVIEKRIASESTVVIVSHSESTIKNYCNRAMWIENGCTKMVGETADVLAAYAIPSR